MAPSIQKIIIGLVTVLLIGFFGYKMFIRSSGVVEVFGSPAVEETGQDVLTLVGKLNAISIDQNIFSGPLFQNLKDFTEVISPELKGRPNPFATIGSDI